MKKYRVVRKICAVMMSLIMAAFMVTGCGSDKDENGANGGADNNGNSQAENTTQLSGELNLFTWDGMFPQEILDGFEKEPGVRIRYSNFDSDVYKLA